MVKKRNCCEVGSWQAAKSLQPIETIPYEKQITKVQKYTNKRNYIVMYASNLLDTWYGGKIGYKAR